MEFTSQQFLQHVFTVDYQIHLEDYLDCVQYCFNGRCVTHKNKFVCLCNTDYTGDNCTKRGKPFPQTTDMIKRKNSF